MKMANGGLKMIDIQSYFMFLKASWVSRLASNQLVNWKVIPCKYFAKLGKEWLVFSQNLDNITVNKYAKQITEFYGEVLRSWNKIGGQTRTPLNFADVRKQIIWGNKFIKFDHKTLLFNNWINNDFYLTLYTFSFEINESSLPDTRCCITTLVIKEWCNVARDVPCRTTLTLRHTIGMRDKTQ